MISSPVQTGKIRSKALGFGNDFIEVNGAKSDFIELNLVQYLLESFLCAAGKGQFVGNVIRHCLPPYSNFRELA